MTQWQDQPLFRGKIDLRAGGKHQREGDQNWGWQEIDEHRLLTHWWRNIIHRILVAMDMILFLVVLATIVLLSVPLGADSRNLSDHAYKRDSLWSR